MIEFGERLMMREKKTENFKKQLIIQERKYDIKNAINHLRVCVCVCVRNGGS